MMGSHGLLAKCVMFEEAVRVPLLIRLPGQKQGRRITGPVSHIDIVPTLLDLLHQPVSSHLQGASLCEFLEAELQSPRGTRTLIYPGSRRNHNVFTRMRTGQLSIN